MEIQNEIYISISLPCGLFGSVDSVTPLITTLKDELPGVAIDTVSYECFQNMLDGGKKYSFCKVDIPITDIGGFALDDLRDIVSKATDGCYRIRLFHIFETASGAYMEIPPVDLYRGTL